MLRAAPICVAALVTAIVLAAGKGKRMKSPRPKVMHKIAGAPMLTHVLRSVRAAGIDRIALVIAPGMEEVADAARAAEPAIEVYVQEDQLGTGHALLCAANALGEFHPLDGRDDPDAYRRNRRIELKLTER